MPGSEGGVGQANAPFLPLSGIAALPSCIFPNRFPRLAIMSRHSNVYKGLKP